MGLMQQAYDTYCAMAPQYAGIYGKAKEPLVPVSHQIVNAELELTLDADGHLLDARSVEAEQAATIIPVTESSSGRTGKAPGAHPLCDQIQFLSPLYPAKYESYLTQLHRWELSPYSLPKLSAIARYVERGTIVEDLAQRGVISLDEKGLPAKEKQMVRWRVETGAENETPACWQDQSLFQAFIDYYASTKSEKPAFCMVTGKNAPPASQHPKKIINLCANAKLISANDTSGFTYRGRFTDDSQAATMSYEASQKIHSALHWLAATQGVFIGGRTFLCWNPQGIEIPKPQAAFLRRSTAKQIKYSDYRKALSETLRGWQETIPRDAGAVVAAFDAATSGRLVSFSYAGASPALMGKCAEAGIGLAFCSPHGRFLARICGESSGNVLLRREQYRIADDPARSCEIARTMIFGKLCNGAASIQRTLRDHAPRVADCGLENAAANIRDMLPQVLAAADLDTLRGIEGAAATAYFGVFDHMLLNRKEAFFFHGRSRRPPLDRVNAMLSFAYSLLAHDCASALESVGPDSYVGFLHRDRPGRQSLALDLMEELRPCMADRFVLTLVNNRMLRPEDFQMQDSGAVLLSDDGRRKFLKTWQERKRDTLTHPYLGEKLSWGMIPYVQALLLARCLRGDLDGYPPFLWK